MSALRPAAALATALFLVTLSTGAAGQGVRPGTAEGAELVKVGWWWAGNETPLDETVLAPPQSSPPNVPKGALPVAAAGGEPEKLSALEFRIEGEPGDRVESAQLVLKENAQPGASVNAERAVILACPVTESFWADGSAGAWKARPAYDCEASGAKGERDPAGLWTFDLTSIAASWLLEDTIASPSVVLVEGVQNVDAGVAPESFQVSFDGPAAEGIGFTFITAAVPSVSTPTEPGGSKAGGDAPTLSGGAGAGTGSTGSTGGSSGGSSGGLFGGSLASSGAGASGPLAGTAEVAPLDVPAADSVDAAVPVAAAETAPAAAPLAAPAWYSGIPRGGYLLLPLVLGLGYLMMLALGPDAQPSAGPTQHGVGRALERLRTMSAALTAKVNS